jgi:hypothetical protein
MLPGHQLDLFAATGIAAASPAPQREPRPGLVPSELDDAALIVAITDVRPADCSDLIAEVACRRLIEAVPALEALCRRFKGFGLHRAVPEQIAAVNALAALGGPEAGATLVRILCDSVVQGPGLVHAVRAAAALRVRLPAERSMALLRQAEPAIRAEACRCAPPHPSVIAILVDLLGDLHPTVARAAACALGEFGCCEARPMLRRLLHEAPMTDIIAAVAAIADADLVVELGRIARTRPDLTEPVRAALEDIDNPRAGAVVATLSSHASNSGA